MTSTRPALVLALLLSGLAGIVAGGCASSDRGAEGPAGDAVLAKAFEDHARDLQVEGSGTVERILKDDTEGGRHQRFVVRLASGQTLLIAHNIDVAPRVAGLGIGDDVAFRGVYEWSSEGGAIHWTHHDPDGRHAAGWIRRDGRTYQ
jgi:Protein of unknown function (DUF3465)